MVRSRFGSTSRDANAAGGGDVGVGGTYGDDDDVRGRDEGFRHLLDVADDGYGLIRGGNLGQAGHVDEGEVGHVGGTHAKHDGF